ncbi:MAG TPA: serine/threonine-protein kinase [Candidatus Heimdallarchaeota archaeon]|nr:serine/threonine-protein kinase [Candidatus Heimdallarchaeota archaeon]
MIGKIISHYKILEKIGEGGMGVVYKAEDTRLKRTVALKFLPKEFTRDKDAKDRFIQEAQAAGALDHPNICTVYEIDEVEGQIFIVMAYIEGQDLKERIKSGLLEIEGALEIAIQVADSLKEAHENGIIHRDIKPANIILTEKGQAKIMDFGLAKLSWGVDLTKTATIMGTAAYMSPEQVKGEEVDNRTDIWSLGAMLYEMLTGERPFKITHDQVVLYAILNEDPVPITKIRKDIPQELEKIVKKALEKNLKKRYEDMDAMLADLKSVGRKSVSTAADKPSIAVLPFVNMSADPENEYFSDGLCAQR